MLKCWFPLLTLAFPSHIESSLSAGPALSERLRTRSPGLASAAGNCRPGRSWRSSGRASELLALPEEHGEAVPADTGLHPGRVCRPGGHGGDVCVRAGF